MSLTAERVAGLEAGHPGVKVLKDGAVEFVYLAKLPIQIGNHRREIDALLCAQNHSGYDTRLFLAEPIAERSSINGQPANWTAHNILGRTWHSWSWRGVSAALSLPQMLLAHLGALR